MTDDQDRGVLLHGNQRGPDFGPDWPGRRCGAKAKSTGRPCQSPAMKNGRCRMHGGKSRGSTTPEGRARQRAAAYKHGYYTKEAKAARAKARAEKRKEVEAIQSGMVRESRRR